MRRTDQSAGRMIKRFYGANKRFRLFQPGHALRRTVQCD
jgi:hypothetical protein